MILLEQIGKSLRPFGGRKKGGKESWVEKSIRQFAPGEANRRERQILYAVRCAFAHEFGLFNRAHHRPEYQVVLALDDESGGPLIKYPHRRWDGDYRTANPSVSTYVNLWAVCEVAEAVIRSVRTHSNATTLRSELDSVELQRRFGFDVIYPKAEASEHVPAGTR